MAFKERYNQDPSVETRLRAQVDDGVRSLLTEMQQGKSERLAGYLEFSARFRKYSLHNQFLIYLQCPQATFVAGYRKWQEMGYQVGRGKKGLPIHAPRFGEKQVPERYGTKPVPYFVPVSFLDASMGLPSRPSQSPCCEE